IGALAKAAELLINMVSAAKMVLIFIGLPHFVVIARLSLITIYVSIHRNSIDTGKMRRSSLDPTFLLA
ncbi:hypothetical protein, partial [Aeromonas caviae]|uniref:hypothetical protein n=1 Tax=Aeromonas caviae TaxID=648 RepID=UPI0019D4652E